MFHHLATQISYYEKLKLFHTCCEQRLWEHIDPTSCKLFGHLLEFCEPQLLLLQKYHGWNPYSLDEKVVLEGFSVLGPTATSTPHQHQHHANISITPVSGPSPASAPYQHWHHQHQHHTTLASPISAPYQHQLYTHISTTASPAATSTALLSLSGNVVLINTEVNDTEIPERSWKPMSVLCLFRPLDQRASSEILANTG